MAYLSGKLWGTLLVSLWVLSWAAWSSALLWGASSSAYLLSSSWLSSWLSSSRQSLKSPGFPRFSSVLNNKIGFSNFYAYFRFFFNLKSS